MRLRLFALAFVAALLLAHAARAGADAPPAPTILERYDLSGIPQNTAALIRLGPLLCAIVTGEDGRMAPKVLTASCIDPPPGWRDPSAREAPDR